MGPHRRRPARRGRRRRVDARRPVALPAEGYPVATSGEDALSSSAPRTSPSTAPTSATSTECGAARACRTGRPLPVITAVDVAEPILVIGTSYDPSTPGRHADELAAALGDAVADRWEGVGHTAFPVDPVRRRRGGRLPRRRRVAGDGADAARSSTGRRPTRRSATSSSATSRRGSPLAEAVLVADGMADERPRAWPRELAGADHRVQTHLILGVTSAAAVDAGRRRAPADAALSCRPPDADRARRVSRRDRRRRGLAADLPRRSRCPCRRRR